MTNKFKVWDLEYHEWLQPLDFINHLWKTNHSSKEVILDDGVQEGYKVLFFTGLKDKNGREIYEGDVIKMSDGTITDVYCDDCGYGWILNSKFHVEQFSDLEWLYGHEKYSEVIGNIYENPDLI